MNIDGWTVADWTATAAGAVHRQPERSSPDLELTSRCWETQQQIGSVHSIAQIVDAPKGGRSVQRLERAAIPHRSMS